MGIPIATDIGSGVVSNRYLGIPSGIGESGIATNFVHLRHARN